MLEICYTSSDQASSVYAYVWMPPAGVSPRAVLQLVHGFSEHMGRYSDFAGFMALQGYIVCGNDQLGHGKSAAGTPGRIGKGGHKLLAKDAYKLTSIIKKEHQLPIVIMGVGAGSLVARYMTSLWGIEYDGAIFTGTMDGGFVVKFAHRLFSAAKLKSGKEAAWLNKMFMERNARSFRNHPEGTSWLTRDEAQANAFAADPLCGFPLTYGACQTLLKLARITSSHKWPERMPKNLPIYLFSGLEDPVGGFGRGIIKIYADLVNAGCGHIEIRLYEDARHEMLFELNRQEVYEDTAKWIEDAVLNG